MWRRAYQSATSARATMTILVMLAVLLTLNVVIPQEAIVGPMGVARAASRGPVSEFILVHMRLSRLSTSPLFLLTLAAFFLNLTVVLVERTRSTLKRLRSVVPNEAHLRTMAEADSAVRVPRPAGWDGSRAVEVLTRLGYTLSRPGPSSVWGVRHRTAVLGFPLFHLSFFVLLAGGVALYGSRYVEVAVVSEGQSFETTKGRVVRQPPWRTPSPLVLAVERVEVKLVDGRPVQLGATIRRLDGNDEPAQQAWVNHPAEWGPLSVLVEDVGLVPVFWLQDARGYTVDRVAVLARGGDKGPVRTPLGEGTLTAEVKPIRIGPDFPMREALASVPLEVVVREGDAVIFQGTLHAGEWTQLGDRVLRLQEVKYWVFLRAVDEYGGLLLVAGFLLGVVGLTWRMVWFRREVGVHWSDETIALVSRVEYYPRHFRDELEVIRGFLLGEEPAGAVRAPEEPEQ